MRVKPIDLFVFTLLTFLLSGYSQAQVVIAIVCSDKVTMNCDTGFTPRICGFCTLGGPLGQCANEYETRAFDRPFDEQIPVPPRAPGFSELTDYAEVICSEKRTCTSCLASPDNPNIGFCTSTFAEAWTTLVEMATFTLQGNCRGR